MIRRILTLFILISPSAGWAQGLFIEDDTVILRPISPNRPTAKQQPSPAVETVVPLPPIKPQIPVVTKEEAKTEAQPPCPTCTSGTPTRTTPDKIDPSKVAGEAPKNAPDSTSDCMRKVLLEKAKKVAKRIYGNRGYSGGKCGQGVGYMLHQAGLSPDFAIGDAISWHNAGYLKKLGFENIMTPNMTPETAPPGAVLIFRGPKTDMNHYNGGLPPKRPKKLRRGLSAGNWVGHVTIAGEKPQKKNENKWYYTDGRTEEPAVRNRTLVAVYIPVTCGANCSGEARACTENKGSEQ